MQRLLCLKQEKMKQDNYCDVTVMFPTTVQYNDGAIFPPSIWRPGILSTNFRRNSCGMEDITPCTHPSHSSKVLCRKSEYSFTYIPYCKNTISIYLQFRFNSQFILWTAEPHCINFEVLHIQSVLHTQPPVSRWPSDTFRLLSIDQKCQTTTWATNFFIQL